MTGRVSRNDGIRIKEWRATYHGNDGLRIKEWLAAYQGMTGYVSRNDGICIKEWRDSYQGMTGYVSRNHGIRIKEWLATYQGMYSCNRPTALVESTWMNLMLIHRNINDKLHKYKSICYIKFRVQSWTIHARGSQTDTTFDLKILYGKCSNNLGLLRSKCFYTWALQYVEIVIDHYHNMCT